MNPDRDGLAVLPNQAFEAIHFTPHQYDSVGMF